MNIRVSKHAEQQEWLQHDFTKHAARELRAVEVPNQLVQLLGAARVSSDPKVREAVADYESLLKVIEFLEGKK